MLPVMMQLNLVTCILSPILLVTACTWWNLVCFL